MQLIICFNYKLINYYCIYPPQARKSQQYSMKLHLKLIDWEMRYFWNTTVCHRCKSMINQASFLEAAGAVYSSVNWLEPKIEPP